MTLPKNSFPLSHRAFQYYHFQHLKQVPGTRAVEAAGKSLTLGQIADVRQFTAKVCGWGGRTGNRVPWRIAQTPDATVLDGFNKVGKYLQAGEVLLALAALQSISGLGSFSYSSKHLRMMAPNLCGVYDSIVEQFLNSINYSGSRCDVFLAYCRFCQEVAGELTHAGVKLGDYLVGAPETNGQPELSQPPGQSQWTAADVDMACFAWLQKWEISKSDVSTETANQRLPKNAVRAVKKTPPQAEQMEGGPLYLYQQLERDEAFTIRESTDSRWNLAWISRSHGGIDFKAQARKGHARNLIQDLLKIGIDVTTDPRWRPALGGETRNQGGSGYLGCLQLECPAEAVRYLKQFFKIVACPGNQTETQVWINAL